MQDNGHEFSEWLYYMPEDIDKEGSFWPLRAGMMTAKPGYYAGPRRIKSYSMHFVRRGEVQLEYGREGVVLTEGDIFCLYPMQTYVYREIAGNEKLEMCWLNIDGPRVEQMLTRCGLTPSEPFIKNGWTPSLQRTINRMLDRLRQDTAVTPSLRLEIQSLLYRLFSQLMEGTKEECKTEPADWIKQCMDYITTHAAEGISVQRVAEWAGVNRTYFSSLFSRQIGMTPIMYITKIRMDRAMRMLVDTGTSVTDIAQALGYPSLYSFTRAFKNRFGLSPTQYRNKVTIFETGKGCRK